MLVRVFLEGELGVSDPSAYYVVCNVGRWALDWIDLWVDFGEQY